ncbi:MAG: cob(I)yrinic acid a,c-diamide adenosyltransferase [Pseudomonadales bacterium]|nr:cob(I)yrinic acid a,c-diamide adenosyltransferase [Candidatus Woesebacteria bacterium]MCB9802373.1 cob(I)yrinic acid a,c-diamide adenosyltransferase [Pseudomonadales bacterium]
MTKQRLKQPISISTKTGDGGESGLANGERLAKSDPVFEVLGTLDELNSWVGLLITQLDTQFAVHKEYLLEIQDTLFYIGAEVARSPKAHLSGKALEKLETKAAVLENQLADDWHTKFIYPGGTELGAHADLARSVCRRSERVLTQYMQTAQLSPILLQYLNRLSDYLYLLRCFFNDSVEYEEREFSTQ